MPEPTAAYPARQQALKLLDDLCQDSLDVELSHVDALDRDGVLHQYAAGVHGCEWGKSPPDVHPDQLQVLDGVTMHACRCDLRSAV